MKCSPTSVLISNVVFHVHLRSPALYDRKIYFKDHSNFLESSTHKKTKRRDEMINGHHSPNRVFDGRSTRPLTAHMDS